MPPTNIKKLESNSRQDGKASVPRWYRILVTSLYGASAMRRLDHAGGEHDVEIAVLGWGKANSNMRLRMKTLALPFFVVRFPVSIGIAIYRRLPQFLKNLYHENNIMKILQTKMKGWLTNLSLSTVIAGLLSAQADLIPAFNEASNMELNWLSIAGLLGAIWGIARRFTSTYKNH